ncbi:unnamed protein product [Peronospora effusa]|nr:unnamed protein product [Peronospora effusa]
MSSLISGSDVRIMLVRRKSQESQRARRDETVGEHLLRKDGLILNGGAALSWLGRELYTLKIEGPIHPHMATLLLL